MSGGKIKTETKNDHSHRTQRETWKGKERRETFFRKDQISPCAACAQAWKVGLCVSVPVLFVLGERRVDWKRQ